MINIESIVYGILSTDSGVASAFSTRIYPVIVPFDSAFPSITYRISGVEPYETQASASNLTKYSIQVTVFSETYSALYALANAVESAMIGHTNTSLNRVFFTGAFDDIQEIYTTADPTKSTGQFMFIRNLEFTLYKK